MKIKKLIKEAFKEKGLLDAECYQPKISPMKSESKKFDKRESQFAVDLLNKQPLKSWLITFELYRLSVPVLYDRATKIVEGENLKAAYESLKKENFKLIVTNAYEL